MSDVVEESGDLDWKAVFDQLRKGTTVEIPCEQERDCVRKGNQVARRTERKVIAVEIHRGEGVRGVEPRTGAGVSEAATEVTGSAFREVQ